jgi:hypothetical protein
VFLGEGDQARRLGVGMLWSVTCRRSAKSGQTPRGLYASASESSCAVWTWTLLFQNDLSNAAIPAPVFHDGNRGIAQPVTPSRCGEFFNVSEDTARAVIAYLLGYLRDRDCLLALEGPHAQS